MAIITVVEVRLLGDAAVLLDGATLDLGARKQRALFATLALFRGESVSSDSLLDALWGQTPPPSALATLHGYIYTLRKSLEPARERKEPPTVVVTTHAGYSLHLQDCDLDTTALEAAVGRANRTLRVHPDRPWEVSAHLTAADGHRVGADLDAALARWRGQPYAELGDFLPAVAERHRLEALREDAVELSATLALLTGDLTRTAAMAEGVIAEHPHRERPWLLRAVALVRMGRQVEALASLRKYREMLDDELGLVPSHAVGDLETAILRQDPNLFTVTATEPPSTTPSDQGSPTRGTELHPEPDAWPLLGRDNERELLEDALETALSGSVQFVQLIGEPGIGKSRLLRHLGRAAAQRGFICAEAHCSQDEGAPPLWPWFSLLGQLADRTGVNVPDLRTADQGQFALREQIARVVAEASAAGPVLLSLDDLHWADSSTLQALRHLVETTTNCRLVVATSRRRFPTPTGAQATLSDALARRHGLRVELHGLDRSSAQELVRSVSAEKFRKENLVQLWERSAGNPFFLVELARCADSIPGSVHDVVGHRVADLPANSRAAISTAAVIGRRVRLDALARAEDIDVSTAVDRLMPALEIGLILDTEGPSAVRFSHPVVQEVVTNRLPAAQLADLHARVASALTDLPDVSPSDLARHWREAGPRYAGETAVHAESAAAAARNVAAYDEEVRLLGWALAAHRSLPDSDDRVLYDLEMQRARSARWGGLWSAAAESLVRAVELADRLGDHEALAHAVLSSIEGAIWYSNPFGEVNTFIVDTLERVLAGLPGGDSELRCRVLLSLGIELYFSQETARVAGYIEDAVAMARRIAEPVLLQAVLHGACFGNWLPDSTPTRAALAAEAVALADSTKNQRALALALASEASALAELGDVDRMWPVINRGLEIADELNLSTVTVFLEALKMPWLALTGDRDHARSTLPRLHELASRVAIPNVEVALAHTALISGLVDDASTAAADAEQVLQLASVPAVSAHAVVYVRRGDLATARRIVDSYRDRFLADHLDFMSIMRWCYGAELGLALGDKVLAAHCDQALAPYAGRSCSAAHIGADGPVDLFRALAAAGVGDLDRASALADDAARQCKDWNVPVAGERLATYRKSYGF